MAGLTLTVSMVGSERSLRSLSPPPCGSSLALPSPRAQESLS